MQRSVIRKIIFSKLATVVVLFFELKFQDKKGMRNLKNITALSAAKSSSAVHQTLLGFHLCQNEPMDLMGHAQSKPDIALKWDGRYRARPLALL
jgi:hypothetical protein